MTFDVTINGRAHRVELERAEASAPGERWRCRVDGREVEVDAVQTAPGVLSLIVAGRSIQVERERVDGEAALDTMQLAIGGTRYQAEVRDPRALRGRRAAAGRGDGPRKITAPMPGKILRVLVAEGDAIAAGAAVLVMEAMKMQNEIKSPKAGVVGKVMAVSGATVNGGDVLAVIE